MDTITPEPVLTPKPHRHFLNKKFGITLAILLLLAGGAYAGIWFANRRMAEQTVPTITPRADDTANWKTYTNTQYGFQFKYPVDWNLVAGPDINGGDVATLSPANKIIVVHIYFDNNLPIGSIFSDFIHKENLNLSGNIVLSEESKNINGAEVMVNIFTNSGRTDKAEFADFLNKDNKIFTVATGYKKSEENNTDTLGAMKIFDAIVASFTFTK